MVTFNISSVFDITCPWCYIGHTYLHRAIAAHKAARPTDRFNQSLISFYLKPPPQLANPTAPPFPVATQSRQKLREETYGRVNADSVLANIKRAAQDQGLPLKFNGLTGTTRNGHRLVQYAQKTRGYEAAETILHSLFKLYHEQEVDITQLSVLTDAAVECGLGEREEVQRFLTSGEDGEMVDNMYRKAARQHAGGVPWFVVKVDNSAEGFEISGAQSDVAWLRVFENMSNASS